MNTTDDACTLHVFGDDCEWVIAHDLEDAKAVMCAVYGGAVDWEPEQEPDEKSHACNVGPDGKPDDGGHGEREILTNAEWAARLGRGYFCTTEF